MKNYIRSAIDTLDALDFRLDHEDRKLRTDRWVFTHANAPDERITLNFRMSEQAARVAVQRARVIVGLATSDGRQKREPKANQRAKMERAAEQRRREAAIAAAEARHAARQAERELAVASARRQELDRLLRGKDAPEPRRQVSVAADAMLTIEQIADQTGLTDKAVQRAIISGALTAYQCGRVVKAKGSDVREWLEAS